MTPTEFKEIRINAGLNHKELAKALRVTPVSIYRYEDGSRAISGPIALLMEMIDKWDPEFLSRIEQ